jgi:hypothetical protein
MVGDRWETVITICTSYLVTNNCRIRIELKNGENVFNYFLMTLLVVIV